jgi:hypothetical protein
MAPDKDKIKFHYIKANHFRVVHVDGVFGGLSPSGDIFASLFSQRPPIPTLTVQPIKENGELGDEIISERASKDGIVREMEVGLAIRPEVAQKLIGWLQEKVDQYNKLKTQTEQQTQEEQAKK